MSSTPSDVDTDVLGHSYYGNAESVISDICHVVTTRTRAPHRSLTLLQGQATSGEDFWKVKRETSLEAVWAAISQGIRMG